VAAANARTIVAVMGGSAVLMERWRQRVAAILLLWYPGMEGGHAFADVLLGHVDPSGRLPFAIPTDASHLPQFEREAAATSYDLWHGQWKLDRDGHAAAYPFGFGLSYTSFELADAVVSGNGENRVVHVTVANIGRRTGTETVQVYGGLPSSRYERPHFRLLGFGRAELTAGASCRIDIPITMRTLAVRRGGTWLVEPGCYELKIGRHANHPLALPVSIEVR